MKPLPKTRSPHITHCCSRGVETNVNASALIGSN